MGENEVNIDLINFTVDGLLDNYVSQDALSDELDPMK